jgi:hypothetical protein
MRWVRATLGSLLTIGGVGLTIGIVWAAGIPTYPCAEGIPQPSHWIYAGLVLFAVGVVVVVLVGTTLTAEEPIFKWVCRAIALVEALAAFWLAHYLSAKYSHYMCG